MLFRFLLLQDFVRKQTGEFQLKSILANEGKIQLAISKWTLFPKSNTYFFFSVTSWQQTGYLVLLTYWPNYAVTLNVVNSQWELALNSQLCGFRQFLKINQKHFYVVLFWPTWNMQLQHIKLMWQLNQVKCDRKTGTYITKM